ncbi:hypothetical protein AMECASPLE_037204 [Ameca splendens]|uniref:Uncharacterized protein n=1 Tax=Ameca splendens TaxID=208324 RepID=A0ABV1A4C5_9TELE
MDVALTSSESWLAVTHNSIISAVMFQVSNPVLMPSHFKFSGLPLSLSISLLLPFSDYSSLLPLSQFTKHCCFSGLSLSTFKPYFFAWQTLRNFEHWFTFSPSFIAHCLDFIVLSHPTAAALLAGINFH